MWTHGSDGQPLDVSDLADAFSARLAVLDRLADGALSTPGVCERARVLAGGVQALCDDWRMVVAALEGAEGRAAA